MPEVMCLFVAKKVHASERNLFCHNFYICGYLRFRLLNPKQHHCQCLAEVRGVFGKYKDFCFIISC